MAGRVALLLVVGVGVVGALGPTGCGRGNHYEVSCRNLEAYSTQDTCPGTGPCPTPDAGQGCVGLPPDSMLGDQGKQALEDEGFDASSSFPVGCTVWLWVEGDYHWCTCGGYFGGQQDPHEWLCPQ